jgi:hypothetical protein
MPQLHYLDLSERYSDCALPGQQLPETLEGFKSVPQLQALAEGLTAQPVSSKARELAKRIYGALEAHQRHLLSRLPAGFPLLPTEEEQMRVYAAAWRALGRTYARWCFAQMPSVEMDLLVGAIACLRQIVCLFGCYHHRLPNGLWLDLHALFQQAQQAELSGARGRRWGFRRRVTPAEEYFRVQLLGLADPYGLSSQEVILLDALLEKWAAMVRIADGSGEGWHLDGKADAPASWGHGHGPRLDLTRLATLFADHRKLATPLGRFESWHRLPETIPVGLLERLERYWFQPPLEPAGLPSMECAWVIGLEDIFARLQGEATEAIPVRIEAGWAEVAGARPGSLQLGDLVGVFARDGGDWRGLARVARLEWSESVQRLRVQLEAIEGEVFPVGIQPLCRISRPCAYQRGLLLAEAGQLSLLLAEQPLGESLVVRLLYGDKHYPVRLSGRQNPARRTLSCRCVSAAEWIQV